MSTTPKKQPSWLQCSKCCGIIAQTDFPLHKEDCPPSSRNWDYGFISDKVLFSKIETAKPEELPETFSTNRLNNMIAISDFAMQQCGIALANPVVIVTKDTIAVKTAWRVKDNSLRRVALTKYASELNNLVGPVKLYSMKFHVFIAKEVIIEQVGRHSVENVTRELTDLFKNLNNDTIFVIGNKINVQYYGKDLIYRIIQATRYPCKDNEQDITETIEEVDLGNSFPNPKKVTFYKALPSTTWTVLKKNNKAKNIKIEDIGGYRKLISNIMHAVELGIGKPTRYFKDSDSDFISKGILLYGPCGVGKSMIANAIISNCTNVNSFAVYCSNIRNQDIFEMRNTFIEVFDKAKLNAPSTILIEDIHILYLKSDNSRSECEKKLLDDLLITFFHEIHETNRNILLIVTTSDLDAVSNPLKQFGRLDKQFEIYAPSPNTRKEILIKLLSKIPNALSVEDIERISSVTHAFVASDLRNLCSNAENNVIKRRHENKAAFDTVLTVTTIDFEYALTIVKPSSMKEIFIEIPNVRWSDIGGQHELKLKLQQIVDWPLKYSEILLRKGILPLKGILMYGPPGCCKTMIVKALASESKVNFINIQAAELFSKWFGESEKAVKRIFEKARQVAPSIIFIDEIDAIGGERGSSLDSKGGNVQESVLTQLLIELDGITALGNVALVAATNRPDKIDQALLRPGRIDRIIYVGLPDDQTRRDIFDIKLRNTPIAEDVSIEELVSLTEGYSGAEIHAVCHEAGIKAIAANFYHATACRHHFEEALASVKPRTSSSLIDIYQNFMHNRENL